MPLPVPPPITAEGLHRVHFERRPEEQAPRDWLDEIRQLSLIAALGAVVMALGGLVAGIFTGYWLLLLSGWLA